MSLKRLAAKDPRKRHQSQVPTPLPSPDSAAAAHESTENHGQGENNNNNNENQINDSLTNDVLSKGGNLSNIEAAPYNKILMLREGQLLVVDVVTGCTAWKYDLPWHPVAESF